MLLTLPQEWQWQWQLLLALVAVVFLVATTRGSSKKGLRLPPGPMMLPVLGNLHQVGELPHRSLRELARRHGPVMLLRLGTVRTVVVSSAEAAKEVMKTHDVECCSRPASPGPKLLSYDLKNLGFAPYGEYWREMRRLFVVELLSMRRVKAAAYAREQQVAKLVSNLNLLGGKQPVVLNEHIFGLTDGIIGTVAFGNVYGADQFPHKGRFQEVLDEAMEMMASFSAEDFFPGAGGHLVDRITGLLGRRERVFKELDAFFEVIIEQHLDPARPKPDNGGDLVDVLIGLWKEQRNTLCFTKDHVKAIILDTFIGAIDTSSVTMLWAMSELIRKPRVLRKVQDEIRAMVGHNNQLGRRVQEDDVPNLTYLKMVVKETLRLHPPATLLVPRETMQSCQIGGYDVPAKTRVLVNAWAIGRDPASWSADSEEFNPDRFQGSDIDFNGAHFQLLPFGAGRRICPGLAMGVMNVEFTLANLLYCFDWALPEGMTPDNVSMDEAGALIFRRKASLVLVPTPRG